MSACRCFALYSIADLSPSSPEFRGQDLNLRPPGYEPGELPLLHPGPVQFTVGGRQLAAKTGCCLFCLRPSANCLLLLPLAARVAAEHAGRGELPELVADHVLGD